MSRSKKVHKSPAWRDVWIFRREYTEWKEWLGAGTALFPCGLCARCQWLVFLLAAWQLAVGLAEHSQRPGFSNHTVADSVWPGEKETIRSGGPDAVCLAANGNLCWPQWELDLILCLLECSGVGYSSKRIFFSCLISDLFSLLFLKCTYLRVA